MIKIITPNQLLESVDHMLTKEELTMIKTLLKDKRVSLNFNNGSLSRLDAEFSHSGYPELHITEYSSKGSGPQQVQYCSEPITVKRSR